MESGQAGQLVSSGRDIKPNFADRFNGVTKTRNLSDEIWDEV